MDSNGFSNSSHATSVDSERAQLLHTNVADNTQRQGNNRNVYVYILTLFAALGGFLFGYNTGVISGAMLLLKKRFDLNHTQQELVVSVTIGFAILGAISGGWFNDKFGRKPMLVVSSLIFTVAAIMMGTADTRRMLLIGRSTVGVAIGMSVIFLIDVLSLGCSVVSENTVLHLHVGLRLQDNQGWIGIYTSVVPSLSKKLT